jgi:hypothetical protein
MTGRNYSLRPMIKKSERSFFCLRRIYLPPYERTKVQPTKLEGRVMVMEDAKIVVGKMRNFISPYYDPRMTEIPKGLFLHLFKHSGASLPFRNRGGDFEAFN